MFWFGGLPVSLHTNVPIKFQLGLQELSAKFNVHNLCVDYREHLVLENKEFRIILLFIQP